MDGKFNVAGITASRPPTWVMMPAKSKPFHISAKASFMSFLFPPLVLTICEKIQTAVECQERIGLLNHLRRRRKNKYVVVSFIACEWHHLLRRVADACINVFQFDALALGLFNRIKRRRPI